MSLYLRRQDIDYGHIVADGSVPEEFSDFLDEVIEADEQEQRLLSELLAPNWTDPELEAQLNSIDTISLQDLPTTIEMAMRADLENDEEMLMYDPERGVYISTGQLITGHKQQKLEKAGTIIKYLGYWEIDDSLQFEFKLLDEGLILGWGPQIALAEAKARQSLNINEGFKVVGLDTSTGTATLAKLTRTFNPDREHELIVIIKEPNSNIEKSPCLIYKISSEGENTYTIIAQVETENRNFEVSLICNPKGGISCVFSNKEVADFFKGKVQSLQKIMEGLITGFDTKLHALEDSSERIGYSNIWLK